MEEDAKVSSRLIVGTLPHHRTVSEEKLARLKSESGRKGYTTLEYQSPT